MASRLAPKTETRNVTGYGLARRTDKGASQADTFEYIPGTSLLERRPVSAVLDLQGNPIPGVLYERLSMSYIVPIPNTRSATAVLE